MRDPATRLPLHPTLSTHYPIDLSTKFFESFHNIRKRTFSLLKVLTSTHIQVFKHNKSSLNLEVCLLVGDFKQDNAIIPSEYCALYREISFTASEYLQYPVFG